VSGLLQLGKQQDALDYITNATQAHQEMVGFVTRRIHDPVLGGILLGKMSAAREQGVLLELDPDSYVPAKDRWLGRVDRVLIVGNLVENALDAVSSLEEERRHVWVSVYLDEVELLVEVEDTGVGIPAEDRESILERGFSTKPGSKGIGLSLVMLEVARLGGTLDLESQVGVGSRFVVRLPRDGKGLAGRGEAAG
ncbi:MAG TPA: ATP-binding protein, partial [Chloroflexota bacterium]|nr:ATP-binding protein [Chloroflexota bacterium]